MAVRGSLTIPLVLASSHALAQVDAALDSDDGLEKPLWELGVIGAAFNTPEYPASKDSQNNAIVAPYVVYRGEVFRIGDGSAARAVAVERDWIEIDLSLDAAFNADSDSDSARAGMPDLDYVFEVGPQIKLKLLEEKDKNGSKHKLTFKIQTRAAFSTDFSSIDHRGYVFHPEITFQKVNWFSAQDSLTLNLSPVWATEKLHDYFYQVDSEFTTQTRPAYEAKSGYLGLELSAGYAFNATEAIRVFFGGAIDLHHGSANRNSPLFFSKDNFAVAAGLMWRLYESKQKASTTRKD